MTRIQDTQHETGGSTPDPTTVARNLLLMVMSEEARLAAVSGAGDRSQRLHDIDGFVAKVAGVGEGTVRDARGWMASTAEAVGMPLRINIEHPRAVEAAEAPRYTLAAGEVVARAVVADWLSAQLDIDAQQAALDARIATISRGAAS